MNDPRFGYLDCSVTGQRLRCYPAYGNPVSGSQKYSHLRFEFTPDWRGTIKVVFFFRDGLIERYFVKNNCCRVPDSMTAEEKPYNFTVVGVGINDDRFITTNGVTVKQDENGLPVPLTPETTTETLWGQGLKEALAELKAEKDKAVAEVLNAKSLSIEELEAKTLESLGRVENAEKESTKVIKDTENSAINHINSKTSLFDEKFTDASLSIQNAKEEALTTITQTKVDYVSELETVKDAHLVEMAGAKDGAISSIQAKGEETEQLLNATVAKAKATNDTLSGTIDEGKRVDFTIQEDGKTAVKNIQLAETKGVDNLNILSNQLNSALDTKGSTLLGKVADLDTKAVKYVNDITEAKTASVLEINNTKETALGEVADSTKLATQEANRSKNEADNSARSAEEASAEALKSAESAVSAKTEADRAKQEADRASGMLDDTVISKDKTWSSQNIADHIGYEVSGEGAVVKLDNLMGGYPLEVVSRSDTPVSEMSLYVGGKNLITTNHSAGEIVSLYGIKFSFGKDGSVTLNGTGTNFASILFKSIPMIKNKYYSISYGRKHNNQDYTVVVHARENGKIIFFESGRPFLWKKDYKLDNIRLQITPNVKFSNLVLYPQLEMGESPTDYEPYQGKTYTATFDSPVTEHTWQDVVSVDGDNVVYSSADSVSVKGQSKNIIDDAVIEKDRTFSNEEIVNRFCLPFKEKAPVVSCHPMEGSKLNVISEITPQQEGEGEPSPSNVRNFIKFDSCDLGVSGKNLFDISKVTPVINGALKIETGKIVITTSSGSTGVTSNERLSDFIGFNLVGKTVTLSGKSTGSDKFIYLTDLKFIWQFGQSLKLSTKALTSNIVYYASGVSTSAEISDIQIELAPSPTPYEPYRGKTYSQALSADIVGGSYNWTTKQFNDKGIKYFKKEQWQKFSRQLNSSYPHTIQFYDVGVYMDDGLCNAYPMTKTPLDIGKKTCCFMKNSTSIFVTDMECTTMDDFLKKFDALGVEFVAFSKESTVVYMEQSAQPTAIADLNQLYSNTGDTEVSGRENPLYTIKTMHKMITELQGGKQ